MPIKKLKLPPNIDDPRQQLVLAVAVRDVHMRKYHELLGQLKQTSFRLQAAEKEIVQLQIALHPELLAPDFPSNESEVSP